MKNKIKKYIYPIIFSAAFLISYIFLTFLLSYVIDFPSGSYAPAALAVLYTFAWLIIALPIYCIRYRKIIIDEKLKFIFAAYNCLLIIVSHLLPFNLQDPKIIICFAIWVLFWNIWLFKPQKKSCDETETPCEKTVDISFLFQNKTKHKVAICFTILYTLIQVIDLSPWNVTALNDLVLNTLPLISVVLFLLFLLLKDEKYTFKKWLLPTSLGIRLFINVYVIASNLIDIELLIKYIPLYYVSIIFSCLTILASAFMFIGSLFNFKYINLLKYGALATALLSLFVLIFNAVYANAFANQPIDWISALTQNLFQIISSLIQSAYFMGIFILTTNKKKEDLV